MDRKLARHQLESKTSFLKNAATLRPPPSGWIKAFRNALGMTSTQLADRLGVSQPRVIKLEQAEADGSLTLASLREAAEALGCQLVYALVPNEPLEKMIRDRAREIAHKQLKRTNHTMTLENQALKRKDLQLQHDRLTEQIIDRNSSRLWD